MRVANLCHWQTSKQGIICKYATIKTSWPLSNIFLRSQMTTLPASVPPRFDHWADFDAVKSAYDKCLREERLLVECCQDSNTRWHLVCVRILGHLIHHSPTDDGIRQVVSAIDSCGDDVELHDLGGHYCQAWTRACLFCFSSDFYMYTIVLKSLQLSPPRAELHRIIHRAARLMRRI